MIVNAHPDNVNQDEVLDAIRNHDYLIKGGEVENGVLLMVHLFWQDVQVWLTHKELGDILRGEYQVEQGEIL